MSFVEDTLLLFSGSELSDSVAARAIRGLEELDDARPLPRIATGLCLVPLVGLFIFQLHNSNCTTQI